MYTPRQPPSSLTSAHSSLDPNTGIRVVIQPTQSSYFAGEPFTCTVTFTNTRSAAQSSRVRSLSASFNPGHKRAAHSISSAPLARPPTSPGTPKTAQPFLAHQNRETDVGDSVRRKGLIGKSDNVRTAVLEKRRRNITRALSVDIAPQDIIKRLADPNSPHPLPLSRVQSERSCMLSGSCRCDGINIDVAPTSPRISSPLAREQVNTLPSSHPHARKHSVVYDDILSSQPISHPSPYPLSTPNTASASSFQISLDSITENGTSSYTPTLSEYPSLSDVTHSPQESQGRRPLTLGLGLPPVVPGTGPPNLRPRSIGGHPPHTAFSTTFPLPSTELLLYAYAQLTGTLSVDPAFVPTSSELLDLRDALRKKAAVGGGSLDIGSGTHRRRASGGFFGFLSSSYAPNNTASKGSVAGGDLTLAGSKDEDGDDALPTLETQPSMLAVDLTLAAGETRSCTCSFTCLRTP